MLAVSLALVVAAATLLVRAEVSDRIARLVPVAPGTPISLRITVGDVTITGWPRDEVSVDIVRKAGDAAALARIPADITLAKDGLSIRAAQQDDGRDAGLRTDVTLRVPATAALREISAFEGRIDLADLRGSCAARLERGPIVGRRLAGTMRLETAIGDIRLEDASLAPDGLLRLRTFNGNVAVGLAARPEHARILALSMGGTVTSDIPLTLKDRWGARFGEATLGRGEPLLSIDVVNGNVTITAPAAGR